MIIATTDDYDFMRRALELANEAVAEGNLPIGALVVDGGEIIAEAKNKVLFPEFHPGKHAEIEALNQISGSRLHKNSKSMILYTTQEPCIMCLGAIVLYRIGRVIYGGNDPKRGATFLLDQLTKIYPPENIPVFIGPLMPDICDTMFSRADELYRAFRDNR